MRYLFYALCLIIPGACSRDAATVRQGPKKVIVDESQLTLLSPPQQVEICEDSTVLMLVNRETVVQYHYGNGSMLRSFAPVLDMDSLLSATYGQKYPDRKYSFTNGTSQGMQSGKCQLHSFWRDGDELHIYGNILVEMRPEKGSREYQAAGAGKDVQALLEQGDAELVFMEFVQFMFITGMDLALKNVVPLYNRDDNRQEPAWQKGFAHSGGTYYFPLMPDLSGGQDLEGSPTSTDYFTVAKGPEPYVPLIHRKDGSYDQFQLRDFLSRTVMFRATSAGLAFSTGKDVILVNGARRISGNLRLEKNDWIHTFRERPGKLTLVTASMVRLKHPDALQQRFGADSCVAMKCTEYDSDGQTLESWSFSESMVPCDAGHDVLLSVVREGEHYYFTLHPYASL